MNSNAGAVLDIDRLSPRQSDMVRVICATGGATVRDIHAQIPDPPQSSCGLRTQLNRLVEKGLLKKRLSGRHSEVVYLPVQGGAEVQSRAFERIAREHFGGSIRQAVHELMRLAADGLT